MIVGVASYVATPHVAPYVYVCVGGWMGRKGGGSTRCTLWKQSHWDIQEHGGAFCCVCLCVSVCLYVCKSEMRRASEADCTPAAGLITAGWPPSAGGQVPALPPCQRDNARNCRPPTLEGRAAAREEVEGYKKPTRPLVSNCSHPITQKCWRNGIFFEYCFGAGVGIPVGRVPQLDRVFRLTRYAFTPGFQLENQVWL